MQADVRISIVIPNLNSTIIDETLTAIRGQQFALSQVEVIVVGMDAPGLVQCDELVRMIKTAHPVPPARARNLGIQAARGQIICFIDADCIPGVNWLSGLVSVLANQSADVIGGGIVFEEQNYWTLVDNVSWFHDFLKSQPAGFKTLLPSLNLCVSRRVIDEVGLFDEAYPYPAGEDSEWTTRMRRAGFRLLFEPTACVTHRPNRTKFADVWRHGLRYGRYSIKIRPDYQDFLKTPVYLQSSWTILVLAPFMALFITARIFGQDASLWKYWQTFPGIYISKLAWCLGAAGSLHKRKSKV